jgi:thioredoxin-like negative regulator of GroEL
MKTKIGITVLMVLLCAVSLASFTAVAGCGQGGKPKVMIFLGKSSRSYESMKPVVDKLQSKYKDKVIWINVDYDDPKSKGEIQKYNVSMNPTIIFFNTKGQIKETYMGAMQEEMLSMAIESFMPTKQTTPGSQPGSATTPLSPYPSSMPTTPMSTPVPFP